MAEEVALCFVLGPDDLHVPQGSANLESRNVERGSQHARVDKSKPGTLADRTDPAVCSEPIEALTFSAAQDWADAALADGLVDGLRRARQERDDCIARVPPFGARGIAATDRRGRAASLGLAVPWRTPLGGPVIGGLYAQTTPRQSGGGVL